jgi:hypothetical protein
MESSVSCFQCDLDIPHICHEGVPNARWGWTNEAVAALEGAQQHGFMLTPDQQRARNAAKAAVKKVKGGL